jgi:2-keto-myo-inositol isomerase
LFPLCLNTSTIRPRSLPEKIECAARAGFDLVELWSEDVEAFLTAGGTLAALRARLHDAGLGVPSMIALTGWADIDDASFARRLRTDIRERMETAAALGSPFIVASPPFSTAVDLGVVGARYAELLALGRRIGVRPTMEFLGFVPQINGIRVCLEIIARANDRDATVVLDPFHIFRGGGSFEDVRLVPGHAIGICHFNDAPAHKPRESQRDADRVLPGDGALPLVDMVRSLQAVGYHGPISLELFNEDIWRRDPVEATSEGRRRMQSILQAAAQVG